MRSWSKHILWGNRRVARRRADARRNGVGPQHRVGRFAHPRRTEHRVGRELHYRTCDNIVWGNNIVWGESDANDNIVWGNTDGDNIVWGNSSNDNIVWGNGDFDNIVWGNDGDDNIVWGNDCGGADCDNIVWGNSIATTTSSGATPKGSTTSCGATPTASTTSCGATVPATKTSPGAARPATTTTSSATTRPKWSRSTRSVRRPVRGRAVDTPVPGAAVRKEGFSNGEDAFPTRIAESHDHDCDDPIPPRYDLQLEGQPSGPRGFDVHVA